MFVPEGPSWVADQPYAAVAAGLVVLVVGADLLVRGAVWIALVIGMSRMAVGLTLVAMGTSLPELLVSLTAARTGRSEIAMANVIGSNCANTLLIVGAAAAICAIRLVVARLELVFSLVATALAALPFVWHGGVDYVTASLMVVMLVVFCTRLLLRERRNAQPKEEDAPRSSAPGWILHLALLGGGFVALMYGADWLVEGAVVVAKSCGMSEALIGMTIVAVGTSLPELATSAVAAARKQPEIAVGNVIGSNIFNVGAVLGIAGLLQPFPVDVPSLWRLMVATAVAAVLLVVVLVAARGVPRGIGVLFVLVYLGFLGNEARISMGDGWQVVFQDEFDHDGAPDPTKWSYETGRIRNDEAQFYTVDRRENARVENGRLVIEARREDHEGATYTSASLHTKGKAEWTHAKVEVRAKLPRGRGLWPAIWMLGANWHEAGWPACGEIDVMEFVGFEPDVVHHNVHTGDRNHMRGNGRGTRVPLTGASDDFHVYAVEWDRERMVFAIDGKQTFAVANDHLGVGTWPFDAPFFLLLNVAVGGSWGGQKGIDEGVFPQRMEIDWVRVSARP